MKYVHPAFMAALYLLGLAAAGRGGPARMVRLSGRSDPAALRRHWQAAWLFVALVVAGALGGLLATYLLMPVLLALSLHFQMGMILLGLLVAMGMAASFAHGGYRWAFHLHPLLAACFLLLYLVQALLGLQILGYAPVPATAAPQQEASFSQVQPAISGADPMPSPEEPMPEVLPGWVGPLMPSYAICPLRYALPAPFFTLRT